MLPVHFDVQARKEVALRNLQSLGMSPQECHAKHQAWCDERNASVDISNMSDHEAWLHERSLGLGGSDIGALLAVSPYTTRFMLWEDKCLRKVNFTGNNFTKWGNILEHVIADNFAESFQLTIEKTPPVIVPEVMQWLRVNLDFDVPNSRYMGEVKTASAESKQNWGEGIVPEQWLSVVNNDSCTSDHDLDALAVFDINHCQFPETYFCQVQYAMMIANKDYCFLTALIGGNDERHYLVKANPDFQDLIRYEATYFMFHNVIGKNPPLLTQWELLDKYVECDHSGQVEADSEIKQKVDALMDIKAQIKKLEKAKVALETDVKLFIGDKDELVNDDYESIASWGVFERVGVDKEALEDLYPELFEEFKTVTKVRVLRIKQQKRAKK